MSEDSSSLDIGFLRRQNVDLKQQVSALLSSKGGGGTSGGMDGDRIDRLEERVERVEGRLEKVGDRLQAVETRLGGVEVHLGSLEAAVRSLPTQRQLLIGVGVFSIALASMVYGVGSYMSGTMSTALAAIQTVLAAKPAPAAPESRQPIVIVVPNSARSIRKPLTPVP